MVGAQPDARGCAQLLRPRALRRRAGRRLAGRDLGIRRRDRIDHARPDAGLHQHRRRGRVHARYAGRGALGQGGERVRAARLHAPERRLPHPLLDDQGRADVSPRRRHRRPRGLHRQATHSRSRTSAGRARPDRGRSGKARRRAGDGAGAGTSTLHRSRSGHRATTPALGACFLRHDHAHPQAQARGGRQHRAGRHPVHADGARPRQGLVPGLPQAGHRVGPDRDGP